MVRLGWHELSRDPIYATDATFVLQGRTFPSCALQRQSETGTRCLVSPLPCGESVPESQNRSSVQHEPVVLWRMRRPGMRTETVISPRSDGAIVVWFVNVFWDFGDWTSALRWSDQLRAQTGLSAGALTSQAAATQRASLATGANSFSLPGQLLPYVRRRLPGAQLSASFAIFRYPILLSSRRRYRGAE